ncbi:MAG: TatD family hydrolase [Candidatus Hodarchaeales archaeon]|jgi:TatD DNase family protein
MVYDAHAHLTPDFIVNPEQLLSKPTVEMVANSALSLEQYSFALELAEKNPKTIPCLGIPAQKLHKMEKKFSIKALVAMEKHVKKIRAVGEIGLDYHWVQDKTLIKMQREAFLSAITFANEQKLPIIIHSRKAETDCLAILEEHSTTSVMMHCFAGTVEDLMKALDHDYFISIPTAVCNRKKHVKIAKKTPLEKMLLETDSPFLSPIKGKKNEPAFIKFSEERIANLKGLEREEIALINEKNFKKFYNMT